MRLLKPAWVTHDGMPIFSVDIHPDASRFATGGQGDDCGTGKVIVWNMEPVRQEKSEKNEKVPRLLCQMDNHLACVNCVRWSHNGKYLASGADDNLIMIWQINRFGGPSTVFGSGGKIVNIEHWRCSSTLRGHSGDVLDLAWSAHDAWLASCSVDNTIVVWNALKFPEQIAVLKGHSGLVKGVTWDPVGKYLASQSDDKSLRVWRTLDWQQETVVTEPFAECGGTTHVLRLNWSPDGHYIVSAHAMNNSGPTAQIIEREGWRTAMDFVGHRKAITVVRFNPCILSKKVKKGSDKAQQYSCCAIGSRDRSLSIWLTALKRPLVVTHDLFSNSIMDISWTEDGMELICCSWDGTVAYVDFTKEEIGTPLSKQEVISLHESVYGKSLTTTNILHPTNQVIESAALLKLQQQELERQKAAALAISQLSNTSLLNGSQGSPMMPTDKQIETKTADGRRRITPIFLAPQPDFGGTIQFATTSEHSKIVVEKQDRVTQAGLNLSGSSLSTSPKTLANSQSQPPTSTMAPPDKDADSHHSQPLTSRVNQSSPTHAVPSRIEPMTPLGGKSPDKDKGSPPDKNSDKTREDDLPRKSSLLKVRRKLDPDKARKKFRKDKDFGRNASIGATSTPISHERENVKLVYTSSDPQVAVAKIDKQVTFEIPDKSSAKGSTAIEVENHIQSGAATLHKVRFVQDGVPLWEHVFAHRIQAVSGSSQLVCAACEDQTLSVFSVGGRKLLPSMVLNAKTSFLDCKDYHVMVVTCKGGLYVWNMQNLKAVINNQSVSSIVSGSAITVNKAYLTKEGVPVVVLSDSKAYTVHQDLGCWVLVSRRQDMLHQCTDHYSSQPSKGVMGPLSSLQSSHHRFGDQARAIYRTSAPLQQASTISYLENQLTVCLALKSAKEYKFWLSTYVRFLSQEGLESKLREVCDDLLGPVYKSSSKSAWETSILGVSKRELLQELLPLIATNLQLQRIYTEYQEQLDTVKL